MISLDPHDWLQAEMGFATAIPTPELLGFTRTIENKVYKVPYLGRSEPSFKGL
jgi:hypothetical protein